MKPVPFMERPIPVWFFLLFCLAGALFMMVFGWAVKATLGGSERFGILGKAAVEIAGFPQTTRKVLRELAGYSTGDFKDESIRVRREPGADYTGYTPVPAAPGMDVRSLVMRADRPAMADGWRLLVGAFAIGDEVDNAVLLLSPDLEIVWKWILDEVPVDNLEPRPNHRKFPHGVEILDDGSLIFTFDGSISLQRVNACGERQWATGGVFHHAVSREESGEAVWALIEDSVVRVGIEDGRILRQIHMREVIEENPMIDVLEIRRKHEDDLGVNSRDTAGRWLAVPMHLNDVEPLPAALADRYDGFDAGDLLISARSLNLVFVLDPDTLEIKWWRIGAVQRQHDPDWEPSGQIVVLNNRMSRDFSEIVAIDPATFERTTLFDGRRNNFYTRIRGKQQLTDTGVLIVTSPQQGRAFEVNRDGEVVFEIANLKPDDDTIVYAVSEPRWFPRGRFDVRSWTCARDT